MLDNSKIIECAMAKTERDADDDDENENNNTDNEQYQHLQYLCMNLWLDLLNCYEENEDLCSSCSEAQC